MPTEEIIEDKKYKIRGMSCPHCQNKVDIDIFTDNKGRVWVEELEKFKPKKNADNKAKSGS